MCVCIRHWYIETWNIECETWWWFELVVIFIQNGLLCMDESFVIILFIIIVSWQLGGICFLGPLCIQNHYRTFNHCSPTHGTFGNVTGVCCIAQIAKRFNNKRSKWYKTQLLFGVKWKKMFEDSDSFVNLSVRNFQSINGIIQSKFDSIEPETTQMKRATERIIARPMNEQWTTTNIMRFGTAHHYAKPALWNTYRYQSFW